MERVHGIVQRHPHGVEGSAHKETSVVVTGQRNLNDQGGNAEGL